MQDPEPAPTQAGSVWSLRGSSGCPNQPKHLSATRGLENHDVSEDSEEHQALLQNCGVSVFHICWLKEESLVKPGSPAAGSSTATVGWLVPVLISPSAGSALTGAPHRGTFFLCQDSSSPASAMAVCLQVGSSLLPYTATFLLWQREQRAKHHVLLCRVCRTKMLRVTPPLGRIHHLTVTLIFWLKSSFPSGSFCVN